MDFGKVIFMTDLDGTLLTDDKKILPKDLDFSEIKGLRLEAIEKLSNASGKSLDVTVNLFVSTDRFPQINQLTIIKIRSTTSIIILRFLIFFTILYLAIINPIPTNSDLLISYCM